MREQSKAAKRRFSDGTFQQRYFVGDGIDVGGAPDPLAQYVGAFSRLRSVRTWDIADGDAQYMRGVADESYDFLHSSHCLEHMVDVYEALTHWTRIVKTGGYLVITVPDEDLYEMGVWPSRANPDHKWTFTIHKPRSWSPKSLNVIDIARHFTDELETERIWLLRDFYRDSLAAEGVDQTLTPVAECSIEMVFRKRPAAAAE